MLFICITISRYVLSLQIFYNKHLVHWQNRYTGYLVSDKLVIE